VSPDRGAGVRETNQSLVLRTVLGAGDGAPLSRANVAAATSLTRSTVSRLVDELVAARLLRELAPVGQAGPGRPGRPLVAGHGVAALGLQANAGYLAARVLDLAGRVVASARVDGHYAGRSPAAVLGELGDLSRDVLAAVPGDVRVVGAGLALPGIVTGGSGRLMVAPNLGWQEVDVAPLLALPGELGAGLAVGNEASLAATGVAHEAPGRGQRHGDFIYLSGEVGIGGAVMIDGTVLGGGHGWFGELGHVCVDPNGPACPCGSTGCLERYAGVEAILGAGGLGPDTRVEELVAVAGSGAATSSPLARALDEAAWALGVALASAINILDVHTVVLGGHLGQLLETLRPRLQRTLDTRVLSARWVRPSVHAAPPDPAPGATGAAIDRLDLVLERPSRWSAPPAHPGTAVRVGPPLHRTAGRRRD
jgi:predicted NBD/HSP70 family sugar kinase